MSDSSNTSPQSGKPVRKPRPVYLDDPRYDRLLNAVVELTAQLYISRDRAKALEKLLITKGVLTSDELDNFRGDTELEAELDREREELVAAVITKNLFEFEV